MKERGEYELQIDSITGLPDDFEGRIMHPRVAVLADSIDNLALINKPVIRWGDNRYVAGADRIASRVLRGHKTIMVKYWELSDREVEMFREAENAYRRHDVAEMQAARERFLELYTKEEEEREKSLSPGKRKSPRARARERVAQDFGIKPESLRKADQRDRAKEREQNRDAQTEQRMQERNDARKYVLDEHPVIGVRLTEKQKAAANVVHGYYSAAVGSIMSAQRELKKIESSMAPYHRGHLQLAQDALSEVSARLRGYRPYQACPVCKAIPEVTAQCGHCGGSGYTNFLQRENMPPKYLEQPVVLFNAQDRHVEDFGVEFHDPDLAPENTEPDEGDEYEPDGFDWGA